MNNSYEYELELKNISKSFGGVKALTNVDLKLKKGTVHSIVGENGAGKSTMMKIISGALQQNSGEIYLKGKKVSVNNPRDAMNKGISIVYQEPVFYPYLSVMENFFSGKEILTSTGNLNWKKMKNETYKALEKFDLPGEISVKSMSELTIGTQQMVLIAKAIYHDASILILDEPTSILSQSEADRLFKIISQLKNEGTSILYISHRMEEIFNISDYITILRDGEQVGYMPIEDADEDKLVKLMSGREIKLRRHKRNIKEDAETVLKVNKISKKGVYSNIDFEVKEGEILGFYGLVGSGRSEIARSIFGDLDFEQGEIFYDGNKLNISSPRAAIDKGIAYLPEDRGTQGTFSVMSVLKNVSTAILPWLRKFSIVLNQKKEKQVSEKYTDILNIKTSSINAPVSSLSGGNQQKVVLARWLAVEPKLLILDEPTRGIDIGTKSEIHELIRELADQGFAIICISSELTEVLALSDNLIVFHEGKIQERFSMETANEENVLRAAIGIESEKEEVV
jgi:ABC-type sugar transport system ATPase subunit